jgi:hypothetical protein
MDLAFASMFSFVFFIISVYIFLFETVFYHEDWLLIPFFTDISLNMLFFVFGNPVHYTWSHGLKQLIKLEMALPGRFDHHAHHNVSLVKRATEKGNEALACAIGRNNSG